MKILIAVFFASFTLSTFAAETVLSCRCEDKVNYLDPAEPKGRVTAVGKTYREAYDKAQIIWAFLSL